LRVFQEVQQFRPCKYFKQFRPQAVLRFGTGAMVQRLQVLQEVQQFRPCKYSKRFSSSLLQ